jgi:hypothetical protein
MVAMFLTMRFNLKLAPFHSFHCHQVSWTGRFDSGRSVGLQLCRPVSQLLLRVQLRQPLSKVFIPAATRSFFVWPRRP